MKILKYILITLFISQFSLLAQNNDSLLKQNNIIYIKFSYKNSGSLGYKDLIIKDSLKELKDLSREIIADLIFNIKNTVDNYNRTDAIEQHEWEKSVYKKFDKVIPADLNEESYKIDETEYYKQCLFATHKGDTIVYIFGHHESTSHMITINNTEIGDVDGGGKYFFRSLINLSKNETYYFEINSPM